MTRLSLLTLVLLLGVLGSQALAASAATFCKCTCFTNSSIIALDPPEGPAPTTPDMMGPLLLPRARDDDAALRPDRRRNHKEQKRVPTSPSCAKCNRAFCLSLNLTICAGVPRDEPPAKGNADVQALCFQRDSRKDEIIVWGFIVGTSGLLVWAALRRVLETRAAKAERAGGAGGLPGGHAGGVAAGGVGSRLGGLAAGLRGAAGNADEASRGAYRTVGAR